ncbi:hypothetical protein CAP47_03050 [Psychroflexus sp. S27]|uniref:hypothetical protein n=1 Tax=Psychroflexus sp. S27 TaxID=1982757 RepID=UPI000C2A9678|nr:hypothetical protein [Psychroflexus sp. S27]PJX24483.1 hypothetical protein CAP47_03050 [Psychroflexus sp. S27]
MKTTLLFSLILLLFSCHENNNKNEETNLIENTNINPDNFSDLLHTEPDEKSLSLNNFKSSINKGFLSHDEASEILSSKHSLDKSDKLKLLYYTQTDSTQKWIYRINSTRKLIIKNVKVFEASKTKTTDLTVERTVIEMTKVL